MSTRERASWLLAGIILGSLLSAPLSAQSARRVYATLTGDLTTGTGTPILCTANGSGCVLSVFLR